MGGRPMAGPSPHSGGMTTQMNNFIRNFSLIFAAGAFGGLVKAMVAWGFGAAGINAVLGSKMAMGLTPMWIYAHVVWGGVGLACFSCPGAVLTTQEARYTAWPRP